MKKPKFEKILFEDMTESYKKGYNQALKDVQEYLPSEDELGDITLNVLDNINFENSDILMISEIVAKAIHERIKI